ncbi:hypothetical protein HDV00_005789 [Rhizophlyctis rosea]|nr:hypothetical protein HDV00_005789 [Rhizophlyctis rosea]
MSNTCDTVPTLHPFRATAIAQIFLVIGDLLITLTAELGRHDIFPIIVAYFVQILLLGLNFVILFIRFAHTYPFRVGMVQIIIAEFAVTFWTAGIYAVALLVYRIYGGVSSIVAVKRVFLIYHLSVEIDDSIQL